MPTPAKPAICIVCAPLPTGSGAAAAFAPAESGPGQLPISWYAPLDQLESHADLSPPAAIAIDPATAASRRTLRDLLRHARRAVPELQAAVLRAESGIEHPDLLVEEGIAVVLTSQFGPAGRPRRPAPPGWPCRNVQWGLWEVLRHPTGTSSWQARYFGGGRLPRLKPGMLQVVDVADGNGQPDAKRLRSIRSQLGPLVATGRVAVSTLTALPELIISGEARQTPGSILRAA